MDWPFIRFTITALCTMFAGAQTVHMIYRPLDDLEELVEIELASRRGNRSSQSNKM